MESERRGEEEGDRGRNTECSHIRTYQLQYSSLILWHRTRVTCMQIEAPFTLKRFHSYTKQLLRIPFRIRAVYIDTNSQEYEEAKGAKNAKTLEVRPKTTEKSFSFRLSTFWYALKTIEAEKIRFHPFTHVRYATVFEQLHLDLRFENLRLPNCFRRLHVNGRCKRSGIATDTGENVLM